MFYVNRPDPKGGDSPGRSGDDERQTPSDPEARNIFQLRYDARIHNRLVLSAEDEEELVSVDHAPYLSNAFKVFNEMRRTGQLCDVVIVTRGGPDTGTQRSFSAHRIVLSGRIPYFRAMFCSEMMELNLSEIHIHEVDNDTMELLINYAYTGKIRLSMTNVQNIMLGANFLNMSELLDESASFLKRRLTPQNAIAAHLFCLSLGYTSIQQVTLRFIQKHFVVISNTDDFLEIDLDDVMFILNRDELYVDAEEQVFHAAMRWIQHDPRRKKFAPKLLSCVRLPLLRPSFLSDSVAEHDVLKEDIACRDLVDEAKDYHLIPERRALLKSFRIRERFCHDVPALIFALGGLSPSIRQDRSNVEVYDPMTNSWSSSKAMTCVRSRIGVAVHDRKIYAVGGFDGNQRLNLAEYFNTLTNEWVTITPLLRKRSAMSAAFLDGKLFVCGGYDGISSLSCVESYCPKKCVWTEEVPMMKQRSAGGVAVLDGYIYVLGGHDGMSIFSSAERYSLDRNEWEAIPPMTSKRCRLGATAYKGKIYAAGGYDGAQFLSSVECFDPETMTWSPVSPMNIRRCRVSLASSGGILYAIAGFDGTSNLSSCECYRADVDAWELSPSLCSHAGGIAVGVVPIPADMLEPKLES